jgi:signal transduction histidine kinase
MLGRQQIAGIPTAISELFKNAYDAYADHVEVDFFRRDGLLILRDDGLGMSREDFENRWLTLATDSKVAGVVGASPVPIDISKPWRPVLGEKGIGRLAIAAIGPQILILTRAKATSGRAELVAALIHWGLFQLPGVNLEDIELPVQTFKPGSLPDANTVVKMAAIVKDNFAKLSRNADPGFRARVIREIEDFRVDPAELDGYLEGPSLRRNGHGTHFFIQPTDESLVPSIEGSPGEEIASPLIKALIGFTNTMTPGHRSVPIRTAFRDHRTESDRTDLIADHEFFTQDEFRNADHHVEGRFDEFGQFVGTVTVYGKPTEGHVVPWTDAMGRATDCGPFRINVAVVQGVPTQSTLPSELWFQIVAKLNRIGGLYIYRDGIRVLPYGNNDYDFLDIERQRSKSASDNYFSYRRIFGVVEIDRENNSALVEKAGREGFRENRAYRQFRDILKNFFRQIAFDFFRERGVHSDLYNSRRAEMDRLEQARKAREKLVSAKRNAFRIRLQEVLEDFGKGVPAIEVASIVDTLAKELASAELLMDHNRAAIAFIEAEGKARKAIGDARERYRVTTPRGVGLPKSVRRDFEAYLGRYDKVISVFSTAQARIEEMIRTASTRSKIAVDRRMRFQRALVELSVNTRRAAQVETQQLRSAVDEVHGRATALAKESLADVDRVVKEVLSRASRLDVAGLDDGTFVSERTKLESEIQNVAEEERRLLLSVVEQLRAISWETSSNGDDVTSTDVTEALEEEVIALRERSEADLELAQLGMAIQVINHEFDSTIKSIRSSIRELHAWADANEALRALYVNIRINFDHLDGYLTLFTPLQRRLYRTKVSFTGGEIYKFLMDLFRERLERDQIALEATAAFKKHSLMGYPSTFYPVFVNVTDNALHWLSKNPPPRRIRLDAKAAAMIVANSGPAIAEHDGEAIFEQGFTRKKGGRGLGLHISRQVLQREGYTIRLGDPPSGMNVAFVIESCKSREEEDE